MATIDTSNKATNIGIGILHPKQQNRFNIIFDSPSLTEDEKQTLAMQVKRFEDQPAREGCDLIKITFEDDVANTLLRALRAISDIAPFNDLTIKVEQLDLNDQVVSTWMFFEACLDLIVLNKLDYATGEAVELTCSFEYDGWDLVLPGDETNDN